MKGRKGRCIPAVLQLLYTFRRSPSLFVGFLKDLQLGEDELTKAGVAEVYSCQLKRPVDSSPFHFVMFIDLCAISFLQSCTPKKHNFQKF